MKFRTVLQVSAIALAGCVAAILLHHPGLRHILDIALVPWSRAMALLSGLLMHALGMHIWVEGPVIHTDLFRHCVHTSYHGIGIAFTAILLACAISACLRYTPCETFGIVAPSLLATLGACSLRIILIIRFCPSPATITTSGLLRDTHIILAAIMVLSLVLNMLVIAALRLKRQEYPGPLPGEREGALSDIPRFWHIVLRRYRWAHVLIPVLILLGALAYALRPARRNAILANLVTDMTAQGNYTNALLLGQRLAADLPEDFDWQLRLIRIMLLDGKPDQARHALAQVETTAPSQYRDQIGLLQTYTYLALQEEDLAIAALHELQQYAVLDQDPLWQVIFLEIALARGDQQKILELAPDAKLAFQRTRLGLAALPVLQSSGNWDVFLDATLRMVRDSLPVTTISAQIMAQLHLDRTSAAAERAQYALQKWPASLELLPAVLFLTQTSPNDWEPRLANLLSQVTHASATPHELLAVIHAAFAASRPDLAWAAYQKLADVADAIYAETVCAAYAAQWFRFRNHALHIPASDPAQTTDLAPFLILGAHLPFLHSFINTIPHADNQQALMDPAAWQHALRDGVNQQLSHPQREALLEEEPELRLLLTRILEEEGQYEHAARQLRLLARTHPDLKPVTDYHLARLHFASAPRLAYEQLRDVLTTAPALAPDEIKGIWPPAPIPLKPRTAQQLPILLTLIELQWANRQYMAATFTMREALQRFPADPVLRTMAADILLQSQRPAQALNILQNTVIRRLPATDELESEALRITGRHTAIRTFRRQRLLPPIEIAPDAISPERLPPAEELFAPPAISTLPPQTPLRDDPISPLFEQTRQNPQAAPDWHAWISQPHTRLEQADALLLLHQLLLHQQRTDDAQKAIRYAVMANPHEPLLWLQLIRNTADTARLIEQARRFCPEDPDLWLADIVHTAHRPASRERMQKLKEMTEAPGVPAYPVETLVRAADFLWRGHEHRHAQRLIEQYHQKERGLLAAHLLGMEAAEKAGHRGRLLYHIEAAIETATQPMPDLYARFIKSKLRDGVIENDGNMLNALRHLETAQPHNLLWTELSGYIRFQRGGINVREAAHIMQNAIQEGSTNRVAFIIAAEGLRRNNRQQEAVQRLRQGLELMPDDAILLNNLAWILAENPRTADEAKTLTAALEPLAERDPDIRETLAVVLLRNNELEAAHDLLARNMRETSPQSRIWFRSQMHIAEIAWRQDRKQVATGMLEQLLRGARNIPDEDVLAANRLLMDIAASP
jgi:predicted Zn-dependent protease